MVTYLNNSLNKTIISISQLAKIERDLFFILTLSKVAKRFNCRVIISGGYAVEGNLQQITRPHNDIDIQIFGKQDNPLVLMQKILEEVLITESHLKDIKLSKNVREMYYHSFVLSGNEFLADIYFVQVMTDPFARDKYVVKKDNTLSEQQFFESHVVTLNGESFEAIDALPELVDKLYKRDVRGDEIRPEHSQDIENLKQIVDLEEVKKRLKHLQNK